MIERAPMPFALTLATVSFILTVVWGRPFINFLKRKGIGKQIRIEGPSGHQTKMGTPTMGGFLFLLPVFLITVVLNLANLLSGVEWGKRILAIFNFAEGSPLIGKSILLPLLTLIGFSLLGARDDWAGIHGKRSDGQGLIARIKASYQVLLALATAVGLYFFLDLDLVFIPGIDRPISLGLLYIPAAVFVIVAMSNAVNLTDGLDGLAGSTSAVAFAAYGIIANLQGQYPLSSFCFAMVGALFAFLWFNSHPAELFMGDTGALALGATLAVVALMTGQWLLLPVVGLVFVAEAASDVLQVTFFKWTKKRTGVGRRIFKMAPIHHHFEMLGWSETHIVWRFFLISLLAGMIGVALALL
ncbi:MAG: phospho-N-acetylmuramoyl-pentapeptide-transferase [Anaerolineae bacterium]|jgi:phospho-N-acetylmuramoyl-pentapeptide-transferase|nr:phospho-N-acetylmuramoyl-pentapeptide-transferase [Anaerolineae bacterium]